MKRLLPLLLFGLVLTGNVAPAAAQVTAQSADSLYAVYLLSVVVPQPDVAHYVVAYAHLLEGTPYAAGSLDRDSVEQLQAHLQETDCTIFVETVLALARTAAKRERTWEAFGRELTALRYRDGLGQRETAKRLGISQMQVSRLERRVLSRLRANHQRIMLMLVMLPMWMNFLLRTYAWMTLLENNGLLNRLFGAMHLFDLVNGINAALNGLFGCSLPTGITYFPMINTSGAVVLGMVYNYLPYMILPLYTIMVKIDNSEIEAAQDLGANTRKILTRVLIPMSMPGISTGITMVFVPSVSTFIISRMLGGGGNMLVGDLIELQFLGNSYNYNLGSAMSLVLMVIVLLCMGVTNTSGGEDGIEGVV